MKLDKRYKQLIAGEKARIQSDYTRQLFRLNEWAEYSASGRRFTGCIRSVSTDGRLQVQEKDGTVKEFLFREIEFIL
jgi:BirA family biotin operon repressor/biotin-[acetyl-CoA-carboxylase] ligase